MSAGSSHARILIVDDDQGAVLVLSQRLSSWGYEVLTAPSGEEALRVVEEVRPDLVLLDVMMPGMDGWEVLRRMKADPATRSIPVAMLTVLHLSEEIIKKKDIAGLVDYIFKPFTREGLVGKVGHIIALSSEAQEKKEKLAAVNKEMAAEYEDVCNCMMLHENIKGAVEKILKEKREAGFIKDILGYQDFLQTESELVQRYEKRKEEIERLLVPKGKETRGT